MRRWAHLGLLAPLLFGACASAKIAPTPAPVVAPVANSKAIEPPAVSRFAELTQELAGLLRTSGACSGVARTMTTFVTTHGAELKTLYQELAVWERGTAEHVVAGFYRKLMPAIDVRIDAGMRCKGDKPTVEAFDRFFLAAGLDLR